MLRPQLEFGLGEFASLEFARESGAVIVAVTLAAFGASSAGFAGGSFTGTSYQAGASSLADVRASAVTSVTTATGGTAQSAFAGSALQWTGLGTEGRGSLVADSGLGLAGGFAIQGTSDFYADALTTPGFDFKGVASVLFRSGATANATAVSTARAEVAVSAGSFWSTAYQAAGVAEFQAPSRSWSMASLGSQSAAQAGYVAQAIQTTDVTVAGAGQVQVRANATASTRAVAAGAGVAEFPSAPFTRVNAVLRSTGVGQVALNTLARVYVATAYAAASYATPGLDTQLVRLTEFTAAGIAEVVWRRGRQVLPFMPPAFDMVERPEEIRGVERPEDPRTADWT